MMPRDWPATVHPLHLTRRWFPQGAEKGEPRPLKRPGFQRRVIEGEGLGGFARR